MSDSELIEIVLDEVTKQYLIHQAVDRLRHDVSKEHFEAMEQSLDGDYETAFVRSAYNDILIDLLTDASIDKLQLKLF